MKFYTITMFLIIFQLVSAYILTVTPSLGFTAAISFHEVTETEMQDVQDRFEEEVLAEGTVASEDIVTKLIGWGAGAVKNAASKVFEPFKRYVMSLPFMLTTIGVDDGLAWMISTPLFIIQFVAIVQFVTGRNIEGET